MFFLFFPISDICSEKWFQCGWTLLSSLWSLHCSLPFSSCNPPRWVLFCRSLQRFAPPDCVNALSEAFFYLLPFPPFYRSYRICFIYMTYIYRHTHTESKNVHVCAFEKTNKGFFMSQGPHYSSSVQPAASCTINLWEWRQHGGFDTQLEGGCGREFKSSWHTDARSRLLHTHAVALTCCRRLGCSWLYMVYHSPPELDHEWGHLNFRPWLRFEVGASRSCH